jgi:hypothetical protein
MNDPRVTSSTWMLALALACVLFVPVAVAEEAEEAKEAEASKGDDEAAEKTLEETAAELRVEEGRTMTNRNAGTMTMGGAKPKKVDIPKGEVFTNALLDKLFGASEEGENAAAAPGTPTPGTPTPATPGSDAAPADPLQVMQDGIAERNQQQRMIADAQNELDAATAKLAKLEVQLLATGNPFSARPDLSDEEKEYRANSGESAEDRRNRTVTMVDEAKAEVKAAEDKLSALRAG